MSCSRKPWTTGAFYNDPKPATLTSQNLVSLASRAGDAEGSAGIENPGYRLRDRTHGGELMRRGDPETWGGGLLRRDGCVTRAQHVTVQTAFRWVTSSGFHFRQHFRREWCASA